MIGAGKFTPLIISALLFPIASRADDCSGVVEALKAGATIPFTTTITKTDKAGTKKVSQMIQTAKLKYVLTEGKWYSMDLPAEDLVNDNLKTAKMRCQRLGTETVNGLSATSYAVHSENDNIVSDSKMWLSSKGLALKTLITVDDTTYESTYDYDHVQPPSKTGDAASTADVSRALSAITERAGGLDGLLTCAGGGCMGRLGEIDDAGWAQALHITLNTAMVSARTCLPVLAARKGAIAMISSVGGLMAPGGAAGYATAKAALIGLTRSLANDYGPDVRVNALCPGLTKTGVGDKVMGELGKAMGIDRDAAYAYATRWFPLRRAAEPIEIARIAAFLLSDWSSYMTGAVVIADGGPSAISVAI